MQRELIAMDTDQVVFKAGDLTIESAGGTVTIHAAADVRTSDVERSFARFARSARSLKEVNRDRESSNDRSA